MVDRINATRGGHIITIEDPIEYLHPHKKSLVSQREVPNDAGTFQRALRAALREAPDVIMLGEMRDRETMQTAITAAETGHLLLSSLHTVGAARTVDRIVDAFPPGQQQQVRIQLSMCCARWCRSGWRRSPAAGSSRCSRSWPSRRRCRT